MAVKPALLDHLAHVGKDFLRRCNRRSDPRLEAIAKSVEVAVGADAGIGVDRPRAAKGFERLEHQKRRARHFMGKMPRRTDTRNAGARNDHVVMLHALLARLGCRRLRDHLAQRCLCRRGALGRRLATQRQAPRGP